MTYEDNKCNTRRQKELLSLYHAMIGGPCEWSENYPDENTIAFDLKNEDLFVRRMTKKRL